MDQLTTWENDLEFVVSRTKHEAFREKCSDVNPKHERWRVEISRQAALLRGEGPRKPAANPQSYPPWRTQAHNLFRDMMAFARSGGKLASKALRRARLARCEEPCEKWDAAQRRCRACGCKGDMKVYSLAAKCPLGKWTA